jgi:predicted amidophosphoribosyltransferase
MVKCPHCGKELSEHEKICWHCENDVTDVQEEDQGPKD